MKKLLNKKGFTLIELIVVIAILAILAMILIPSLTGYISKATKAKDSANCRSLYSKYQLDIAVATGTAPVLLPTLPNGGVTAIITDPVSTSGVAPGTSLIDFQCTTGSGSYSLLAGGSREANFAVSP